MATQDDRQSNRYVNDLRRFSFAHGEVKNVRSRFLPFTVAGVFPIFAGIYGKLSLQVAPQDVFMLVCASAIGAIFGIGFLRESPENPNKTRLKPGHRINQTADDAFDNIESRLKIQSRLKRTLVRRRFVPSIAAARVITVPASALLSTSLFYVLHRL
ncbi:MAG: hypothetical protein ACON31_01305 [Candidatus Puniceispirillaceae bacterium]